MTATATRNNLRGVYAVADTEVTGARLLELAEAALEGGARLVQYRDKTGDGPKRLDEAAGLLEVCRRHDIPLIINDDVELARQTGADGVHLGRNDASPQAAREVLGEGSIIGVSCYNEWPRAEQAQREGADYVAFGSVFPSRTKPGAVHAPLELIGRARASLDLPVCAIGGIDASNAGEAVAAGADMIAVINAVFGVPGVRAATQALARLFEPE